MHEVDLAKLTAIDIVEEDATISLDGTTLTANLAEDARLDVFDLMGRCVFTAKLSAGESVTSLDLEKGFYILRLGNKAHKVLVK